MGPWYVQYVQLLHVHILAYIVLSLYYINPFFRRRRLKKTPAQMLLSNTLIIFAHQDPRKCEQDASETVLKLK